MLMGRVVGAFQSIFAKIDWEGAGEQEYTVTTTMDACAICLEEIEDGQATTTCPNGHVLHEPCFLQWKGEKRLEEVQCATCRAHYPAAVAIDIPEAVLHEAPPQRDCIDLYIHFCTNCWTNLWNAFENSRCCHKLWVVIRLLLGLPIILTGVALDLAVRVIYYGSCGVFLLLASLIGVTCCLCCCDRTSLDQLSRTIKYEVCNVGVLPCVTRDCVRDCVEE